MIANEQLLYEELTLFAKREPADVPADELEMYID